MQSIPFIAASPTDADRNLKFNRIVLNEPHASLEGLYDPKLSFWDIDACFINDVVLRWTDWHTDFLFHGYSDPRIQTVRFPYSRFIVDAERLWDDPLEDIGQGIVYRHFQGFSRELSRSAVRYLLNLWKKHQSNLRAQLCQDALLLDCHSFPPELSDVDVCIGWNEDFSRPQQQLIDFTVNLFESFGYKVGLNNPYSNSMTPSCPFPYKSMMLEINKKAYLRPHSLELMEKDNSISKVVAMLMKQITKG